MLLDIRDTVRNSKPIKYTLITLICIPFALVGIGSYFAGGGYADVAEVDGVAISEPEVERAYNGLRRQYQQMFGGNIPANLMSDESIRQQALDGLVTDIVVRNTVEDQKFAVGDETLGRAIRNDTRFHVDGQFNSERYQDMIRGSLSNVAAYEESLRANTAITQFRAGVEVTSFQLPSESERLEKLSNQTRTIDFVRYSVDKVIENIEIDEEQVSTYFDENAENYTFPQRGKFEYIELKKSDLAADIDISDEDAQLHYNEFEADYVSTPEVRETSHILLEIADTDDSDEVARRTTELEAIKARIEAGESFADVAKEVSEDIGSAQSGGSLGQLEPSYMEAQYVSAAEVLTTENNLSGVVKTQFGLHLIKLDNFAEAVVTPFDEVKDSIVTLLQNNIADNDFLELRTLMEESIASDPETLEVAADASNIDLKTTDWVDVDTQSEPLFSDPRILSVAFSEEVLETQDNSDIIELNPGHVLALRIAEYEDERPKSIDDVRDDIIVTLKREQAETTLDASAKSAVALMLKGTPVSKVAGDDTAATATRDEVLTRQSTVIDASAVSEIYALAKPSEGKVLVKSVALQNGDRVAYALKAVESPEATEAEGDAGADSEDAVAVDGSADASNTQIVNTQLGQAELAAIIANLREKADVSIEQ